MTIRGPRGRRAWQRVRRVVADGERGATAVVVALSLIMLMAAGAFGYDVAKLYYERQQLRNAVDAAAQAGASGLTDTSTATALAIQYANWNFPGLGLTASDITFFCVVKNAVGTAAGGYPDPAQVGATRTCEGKPGWTNADAKCSDTSCAIPCNSGQKCNSIQIKKFRNVDFLFGPAISIASGSTGEVRTLSCKGSCGGTPAPNPMNVVVMADRTPSMYLTNHSNADLNALKSGIQSMLGTMNPSQQYVAFGAIHKSEADGSAAPLRSGGKIFTETSTTAEVPYCTRYRFGVCTRWSSKTVTTTTANDVFTGSWVPIGFSKDYQNTSSRLYTNVANLSYSNFTTSGSWFYNDLLRSDGSYDDHGTTGTHLASAMKGAAQYLLTNVTSDNLVTSLEDGTRADLGVKPRNVIVFETDGQPAEIMNNATSDSSPALSLDNGDDIGASSSVYQGCRNLDTVAAAAKAAGITIVTIGYGSALTNGSCGGGLSAAEALARAASTQDSVTGTGAAGSTCADENTDGDYYYCANNSLELEKVFAAAMGSLTEGTKFMSIPGVGD
ncbi:MAG: hypothetical protein CVT62_13395 [Actinobacteria bacterium HGW-Actinobacteria-2]|nr:MAG: hypothetical protein CVT62_13395 [Actinobacteria bacterium HGW-Actinobacteria-2]